MDTIQPIKRVNISDQVFEQLKNQLLNGNWKPGDKLPSENELSEKFQVSRVTIRQALQKLTALGLLETRFGEGSFVKEAQIGNYMNVLVPHAYLGKKTTLEVLEFRQVVETESAGLAAERATADDIRTLRDILSRMQMLQNDSLAFAKADLDFHIAISSITRNSLIIATNSILNDILSVSMQDIVDQLGFEIGLYYHEKLIDAISAHDSALATDIMREHILKTREHYQERKQETQTT